MLGIVKKRNAETNEIIDVWAKNDCGFDFSKNGNPSDERYCRGYASLGTQDKYNPVDCERFGYNVTIDLYRNCNDEKPLYVVEIDKNGIWLLQPYDLEEKWFMDEAE